MLFSFFFFFIHPPPLKTFFFPGSSRPPPPNFFFFFFFEVQWIYILCLVSGVQQNESVIYVCLFILLSILDYYKILNIVSYVIQ